MNINDNLSKHIWGIPLIKRNSETLTDEFSNIQKTSKRNHNNLETDRGIFPGSADNLFLSFYESKHVSLKSFKELFPENALFFE